METERHLVNGIDINGGDHRVFGQTAEKADLGLQLIGQGHFGAADQDVGLNAIGTQFPHRVLGRLGLDLACGLDIGHVGEVDIEGIFPPEIAAQLPDGLNEGKSFNVADGAADLDDGHIDAAVKLEDCLP